MNLCKEGFALYAKYFVASCVDDGLSPEIIDTWKVLKEHLKICEVCKVAFEKGGTGGRCS